MAPSIPVSASAIGRQKATIHLADRAICAVPVAGFACPNYIAP